MTLILWGILASERVDTRAEGGQTGERRGGFGGRTDGKQIGRWECFFLPPFGGCILPPDAFRAWHPGSGPARRFQRIMSRGFSTSQSKARDPLRFPPHAVPDSTLRGSTLDSWLCAYTSPHGYPRPCSVWPRLLVCAWLHAHIHTWPCTPLGALLALVGSAGVFAARGGAELGRERVQVRQLLCSSTTTVGDSPGEVLSGDGGSGRPQLRTMWVAAGVGGLCMHTAMWSALRSRADPPTAREFGGIDGLARDLAQELAVGRASLWCGSASVLLPFTRPCYTQ